MALATVVPQAGGRTLATTTILLEAIGVGNINGGGLDCGGGSERCYGTSFPGTSVPFTATPLPGWSFTGWADGSTDCSGTLPTCSVPLDGRTHEEDAQFVPATPQGTSTLTVTASTGGSVEGGLIDCVADGPECSWSDQPTGSTLTVVETPDTGYRFDGWAGDCSGLAPQCTVEMDADANVSAIFTLSSATRVLTVSVGGNGTVSGGTIACSSSGGSGCTANETLGAQVTLTATPDPGSTFQGWGGDCTGSTPTCSVSMTSNRSVTATFSGAAAQTVRLSVTVSGAGTVTGGGIDCGGASSKCSIDLAPDTRVTLTATPASGATFEGWAGSCSGTVTTCALTMNAAKSVSATFGGGSTPAGKATLTIRVAGKGTVSTTAGRCTAAGGTKTCKQSFPRDSHVVLTAEPAKGGKLVAWGGACTGASPACTVTLSASRVVTATFTGAPAKAALSSGGRPIVSRAKGGFEVVLRFAAALPGTAHLRALRAGRVMTSFSFTVPAGPARIGPFAIARPGYYTFQLALGSGRVTWKACLGRCGAAAPAEPFAVVREPVSIVRVGVLWSLTVRFRESAASGAEVRIYRGRALASDRRFAPDAGPVQAGPFLLAPGTYTIRLTAIDAYGRTQRLRWVALLP